MSHCWERFIKEGKELFDYMINNFGKMFNEDKSIKHFTIRDEGIYDLGSGKIMNEYGKSIEKELIYWIDKEIQEHRLFNNMLWKPIQDDYSITNMYLGYKILFNFENYYFQLGLENRCNSYDICEYCQKNKFSFCFTLVLYGWKDTFSKKLQPNNKDYILVDNIIPENEWKSK